jgi:hypothetical protein
MLPDGLLDILVCPTCNGPLQPDESAHKLNCTRCGLAFPVRDGIPVMLTIEAEAILGPKDGDPWPG